MKILMVVTSHDQLGNTGKKTGFWLEEFAAPYYAFKDAGAEVTVASPKGGPAPLDPKSDEPSAQSDFTRRFKKDPEAQALLADTRKLATVQADPFDAVFYPGGHGPLWDLAEDPNSIRLIESFLAKGKPVAAVCHGPAALRHVKDPEGKLLMEGRKMTAFSNSEEEAVQLTDVVPFKIEDEITRNGGLYSKGADWQPYVLQDQNLITGQNPASSEPAAKALLSCLAYTHP